MKKILIYICCFVLIFGMGYFLYVKFFSVENNALKFDVYLKDVDVSVVGEAKYTKPLISNTILNSFSVDLYKPGDRVTYQVKVVNNSNKAVKLADIVKDMPNCVGDSRLCNNFSYKIVYSDGTSVKKDDLIGVGIYKVIKIIFDYPGEENLGRLSASNLGTFFIYKVL